MSASRPIPDITRICSDSSAFRIELARPFHRVRGWMYVAAIRSASWRTPTFLQHPLLGNMRPGPANTEEEPRRSTVILCEDDRALGPPHSKGPAMATLGRGRYTHYQGSGKSYGYHGILFSTSDNSDPNTNGRRYRAIEP